MTAAYDELERRAIAYDRLNEKIGRLLKENAYLREQLRQAMERVEELEND